MSVHYKFKSALEYDTVTFDGLHISVKDLKKAIIHQKRIGKNTDFDLQVTNAQTKEVYTDENVLIPKNTSLVIARIPLTAQTKGKPWEGYGNANAPSGVPVTGRPEDGVLLKAVDLTQLDASEDDKIRAMMTQSTQDYDPSNYMKIRGSNQVGIVPSTYRCFKCHQPGHWIKDCPLGHGQEPMEIKKSTGIPRSFMVPVEGPMVPGAMMTPTGQYAVPVLDHQAYNEGHKVTAPAQEEKPEIPEDLLCSICKDILTDAVMIPCCGNSFCDECIRTVLLESEDHECPDCHEKDISPGTLIPNRFLRNAVSNFKNATGYHKRQQYRNAVQAIPINPQQMHTADMKTSLQESMIHSAENMTSDVLKQEHIAPDSQSTGSPSRVFGDSQRPVISEADSTETAKSSHAIHKEELLQEKPKLSSADGPPGVESPIMSKHLDSDNPPGVDSHSPTNHSKHGRAITSVGSTINHHRSSHHQSSSNMRTSTAEHSLSNRRLHSSIPSYNDTNYSNSEERPGTPTVDEPGLGPPGYTDSDRPSLTTLPPSQRMHQPHIQGSSYNRSGPPVHQLPPGQYSSVNPPSQSNFRLPPPGHPDFNRVRTNSGFNEGSNSFRRVLLATSIDPSVPPPTIAPTQGSFGPRPMFDSSKPPAPFDSHRMAGPPPGYSNYPSGSRSRYPPRHMQPPPPGLNHRPIIRTPPGIIDDPLEEFNRILREKDELRARQARRLSRSRSFSRSRSSSRSFSRSPRSRSRSPPPRRHRSRTRSPPPRRRSRSRSRSFSISRSRSFSRSPSFRGSPPRDYSPRRRPPSRYRSPLPRASPPRYNRYKENRPLMPDRDRDRDRMERDRPTDRDRADHSRVDRDRMDRDRDYQYYEAPQPQVDYDYDSNYDRGRGRPPLRNQRYGNQPQRKDYPINDQYYQPPDMCPPTGFPPHNNRYNMRVPPLYPPPLMTVKATPAMSMMDRSEATHRKFEDIVPPGVDQPPVPGFENTRYDMRYPYDRSRDEGPPGVDRFPRSSPYRDQHEDHRDPDHIRNEPNREFRDKAKENTEPEKYERKYSPATERRHRSGSPRKPSRERYGSPDRNRRRKHDDISEKDKRSSDLRTESERDRKDRRKDTSEDEKYRKNKDKKKKREKKEAERKKKKEKKEKKEQEKLKKAEVKKAKEVPELKAEQKEDKPRDHENKSERIEERIEIKVTNEPKLQTEAAESKPNNDLYGDIVTDGIDSSVVENYGKINDTETETHEIEFSKPEDKPQQEIERRVGGQNEEDDDEKEASFDGIELQANEADLKTDVSEMKTKSSEMLAPIPEPSKWEIDDEVPSTPEKTSEPKNELKQIFERPGKVVTSEVLKRAENAIFAKAINAIRPIEIKKLSLDRARLYAGEKEVQKEPVKNIQITIPGSGWNLDEDTPVNLEMKHKERNKVSPPPNRLSVKERLGCKIEELDRFSKDDRNRSRTLSPLSRRNEDSSRNVGLGERRVEIDDRRRDDYRRQGDKSRHGRYDRGDERRHRTERSRSREDKSNRFRDRSHKDDRGRKDDKRGDRRDDRRTDHRDDKRSERSRSRGYRNEKGHDEKYRDDKGKQTRDQEKERKTRQRSYSRSQSRERKGDKSKKIKDKKHHKKEKEKSKEKDKAKKHRRDSETVPQTVEEKLENQLQENTENKEKDEGEIKPLDDKRKITIDEAHFEPDYDLETSSEKEEDSKPKSEVVVSKKCSRTPDKVPEEQTKKKIKLEERSQPDSSSSDSSDSSSDDKHKKKHRKHKKKKSRKDSSSSSSSSDSDSSVERKSKKRHKSAKKLKKRKKSKHK